MSLTTSSRLCHRARCATALSATYVSAQTRGFRGTYRRIWLVESVLDETYVRQGTFRYTSTSYTRRVTSNPQTTAQSPAHTYWSDGGRAGLHSRYHANPATVHALKGSLKELPPSQAVPDTESRPVEHLLFGNKPKDLEYIIDPITNRKVLKSSYGGVASTGKPFEALQAPFNAATQVTQAPIFYDGAPPEAELAKYERVQIDDAPWNPSMPNMPSPVIAQSTPSWSNRDSWHSNDGIAPTDAPLGSAPPELEQYKSVLLDGAPVAAAPPPAPYPDLKVYNETKEPEADFDAHSSNQPPPGYQDLGKYEAVRASEPDGLYKREVAKSPKDYEDLGEYTAVRASEPDGKYKKLAAGDPTEEYADVGSYGAIRAQEPDGHYKIEAGVNPAQTYDDLPRYAAVRAHEPNGKYKLKEASSTTEYDDLDTYVPFRAQEPDGKYKAEAVSVDPNALTDAQQDQFLVARTSDGYKELVDMNPTKLYQDLDEYGPVRVYEPDGLYKIRDLQEPTQEYEDLDQYGAVRIYEPDGKYKRESMEDPAVEYEDLGTYNAFRSHEPNGMYAASVSNARKPTDLPGYGAVRSHEPNGKYGPQKGNSGANGKELKSYNAYRSSEPDGKYAEESGASVDEKELGEYQAVRTSEPNGKYAESNDGVSVKEQELGEYQAFRTNELDGKQDEPEQPNVDEAELGTYKAYLSDEPNGKYASEQGADANDLTSYNAFRSHEPNGKYIPDDAAEEGEANDLDSYNAFRSHEPNGKYSAQVDDSQSASTEKTAKSPKYGAVRHDKSKEIPLTEPTDTFHHASRMEGYQVAEPAQGQEDSQMMTMIQALQRRVLELAGQLKQEARVNHLSRLDGAEVVDPYSHESQGLQTSFTDEVGINTRPLLARHYHGTQAARTDTFGVETDTQSQQSTLYKILAFNPELQTVEVAETTSTTPFQTNCLSPADVLLQLTHPFRFLPYFTSLQASGYELVSGNADILVFRKPFSASATQTLGVSNTPTLRQGVSINPIDMTGSASDSLPVAAARYASPTGFVNYDLLPRLYPTFRSGRETPEEPTSRVRESKGSKETRSPNLPKRMVTGAVFLGGAMYAFGVVSDYFRSGGSDGRGPRGF